MESLALLGDDPAARYPAFGIGYHALLNGDPHRARAFFDQALALSITESRGSGAQIRRGELSRQSPQTPKTPRAGNGTLDPSASIVTYPRSEPGSPRRRRPVFGRPPAHGTVSGDWRVTPETVSQRRYDGSARATTRRLIRRRASPPAEQPTSSATTRARRARSERCKAVPPTPARRLKTKNRSTGAGKWMTRARSAGRA
jgi:hypothetical protein